MEKFKPGKEHEGKEVENSFSIVPLTRDYAEKNARELAALAGLIPLLDYSPDDITAESKDCGKRVFYGKWDHSLVAVDKENIIGLIIGYERKSEDNNQYPQDSIYISELAVDEGYQRQGVAKRLLETFIEEGTRRGMLYLQGEVNFSVQTNSANWNTHVIDLYNSLGFTKRAAKTYDNRTDVVLELNTFR